MLERAIRMRLTAVATVLALAAPVWATEIQMKKKEDPQAQKQAPAKEEKKKSSDPKKNCPTENEFNTLEDLFGLVGPVDPLAQPQQQALTVAPALPGQPAAATAAVEWRVVDAPAGTPVAQPAAQTKKAEPAKPGDPAKKN